MRDRALVASVVGGLLGGLVGAAVMSAVHTSISRARPPAAPPADQREHDAPGKVADALGRAVRREPLPERAKPLAGSIVHYAFGATTGLVHGVAARLTRLAGAGGGLGFGAAVWLGAHVVTVPALGL